MASRLFCLFSTLMSAILVLSACSRQNDTAESAEAVRAKQLVNESFGSVVENGTPQITIQKDALDKEFLLQGAMLEQEIAAMGNAIRSRVVVFTRYGDDIYMLEATQGHVVTTELPAQRVLASFPIVSENKHAIQFDFNKGMTHIFFFGDWYGSDMDGKNYEGDLVSARTKNSRLLSVKVNENNQLAIRQVAQLALQGGFSPVESNSTVEVRYYLSPYRPDPTYKPVTGGKFNRTGFFEVSPKLLSNGLAVVHSTRWAPEKPIVYAVSANTPVEFKQAVKDGILYWNRAFGKEIVSVVEAPEGVTAPDMNYNVVQWVPFDMAGMAFADAQMDPRTGQILHAQVFLTSAFAFIGKMKARQLLKQLQKEAQAKGRRKVVGIYGLTERGLCNYEMQDKLIESLSTLVASDASDKEILKVSQDYVRVVAAHEIGHTLGLRHNFAGSLHTENYPLEKRRELFEKYLLEDVIPDDVVASSTVMDYPEFQEDIAMGYQIRKGTKVLDYDAKAIATLYQGKQYQYGEIALFCTDSDIDKFADCKPFDAGKSLVEYASWVTPEKLRQLPYDFHTSYVAAKAPMKGMDATPLAEVGFEPDMVAKRILAARETLVSSFGDSSSRLLNIFRSFPYVGPVNLELVKEKERDFLTEEIQKANGLDHVLSLIPTDFSSKLVKAFDGLLDDPKYQKGEGLDGQAYEFTEEDRKTMHDSVSYLAKKLPAAIAKKDLDILNSVPATWKIAGSALGDGLAATLGDRVKEYVFTRTGEKVVVDLEVTVDPSFDKVEEKVKDDEPATKTRKLTASLPKFLYALESRKTATKLLNPGSSDDSIDWGVRERATYKKELTELLNSSIGCPEGKACAFSKLKPAEVKLLPPAGMPELEAKRLQKEVTRWFVENKAVLEEFK